jgi:UDP-N-acetylmuramyl pentapeptide phosphotransferase/UDP-N-acetylglucosamine-1-phosphate transferase
MRDELAALFWLLAATAAAAFAISCAGTTVLIRVLRGRAVMDVPNERSSHVVPTPRGGGIAIVAALAVAWIWLCAAGTVPASRLTVVAGMVGLAAISWIDDVRGLPPAVRLLAQFAAVAAGMLALPAGLVFQGWLPPWIDAVAAALLWVWFVNLFNFMDGIDGIAASEAAAVGVGIALLSVAGGTADLAAIAAAVTIAAAALGFLVWNWPPAQIFMGDVGSIPLGYTLGFLLLVMAAGGHWLPALILPAYFLADATITLLRRLLRGERVWQAHREHFYQRAVQRGLSHAAVVARVVGADIVLIGCAWAAARGWGFASLAVAVLTVALLLAALGGRARGA